MPIIDHHQPHTYANITRPTQLIRRSYFCRTLNMRNIADFPTPNYLYIVQEPRFLETFRPLYKFGMVHRQELNGRFRNYPKQTIPFMSLLIDNAAYHEAQIKKIFREKYKPHPEIGSETFEGDVNEMMNDLLIYWKQHFVNRWTRDVSDAALSPEQWLLNNATNVVEVKRISNNRERVSIRKDAVPSDVVEYLLQEIGFKYIETTKCFMTDKVIFDKWVNENSTTESDPVEPEDVEPEDNNANTSTIVGEPLHHTSIVPTENEEEYLRRCEQPLTPTQYGWKIHKYLLDNGCDISKTKATLTLRDNGTNVYSIENIKCVVHGMSQDLPINNLEFDKNESPNTILLTPPHVKRIQRIKRVDALEEQIKANTNKYVMFIHSFSPIKFRRSFYFYTTYLPYTTG